MLSCITEQNLDRLLSSNSSKTSKEKSTLKNSRKDKILVSKSRKNLADLAETDIAIKVAWEEAIDNKGTEELASIGGSITVSTEKTQNQLGQQMV